jgi:hypothetical protein
METIIRIFLPILISLNIFINNKSPSEKGKNQERSFKKRKNDRVTSGIGPGKPFRRLIVAPGVRTGISSLTEGSRDSKDETVCKQKGEIHNC